MFALLMLFPLMLFPSCDKFKRGTNQGSIQGVKYFIFIFECILTTFWETFLMDMVEWILLLQLKSEIEG